MHYCTYRVPYFKDNFHYLNSQICTDNVFGVFSTFFIFILSYICHLLAHLCFMYLYIQKWMFFCDFSAIFARIFSFFSAMFARMYLVKTAKQLDALGRKKCNIKYSNVKYYLKKICFKGGAVLSESYEDCNQELGLVQNIFKTKFYNF